MIPIFIGYDPRQPVSFHALTQSILKHATRPVSITPLVLETLPIKRQGLTPFTYSRFLVPHLMDFRGHAIFVDIDTLLTGDIAELWAMRDYSKSVQVVPHEGHLKFERASVMLFCSEHCQKLTPNFIETADGLHTLDWCKPERIGTLPKEWNHLVGYDAPNPNAKLVHFTQGVPAFQETQDVEWAHEWRQAAFAAHSTLPWQELMGTSVHAKPVYERLRLAQAN